MPESVLVRFRGRIQPGITVRDLVNAIPFTALREGKLNLKKGDEKINVFADRILEIEGLEGISVEDSYKLTDTSAERSAAAATFSHSPESIRQYVENNLTFLRGTLLGRNSSKQVQMIIDLMEKWLADPEHITADEGARYADILEIDLETITEPLLAAPNDPDKIVTLSEASGTDIDEVFVGSCMTDITDFRVLSRVLEGRRVPHAIRLWAVPPDRECNVALSREGVYQSVMESGGNFHVPGCSLCMGNQAQVAKGATVLSTSTRNFDNRMGEGAQVFLGSSLIAGLAGLLGRIPTLDEYMETYHQRIQPVEEGISEPLAL
jgi:aconitate hydratase 2/2-methylisocitrate dehydratase